MRKHGVNPEPVKNKFPVPGEQSASSLERKTDGMLRLPWILRIERYYHAPDTYKLATLWNLRNRITRRRPGHPASR